MSESFVDLGIDSVEDATQIGAGGAATVFRAHQPLLNRSVAVKVIQAVGDPATQRRFRREASALGSLSEHPGIVTVYEVGTTPGGQPYFIMQDCPGGSLRDRLTKQGPLAVEEAVLIVGRIAETLSDAHEQGILHRDLKPANILIDARGHHLVADFGIAALADTGLSTSLSFTPGFVPPEILRGEHPTAAGDVYSLGATLYSLVTGKVPFCDSDDGVNLLALVARIGNEDLDDPRKYGVPNNVASLIERCTSKSPDERPTMRELSELCSRKVPTERGVPVRPSETPQHRQRDPVATRDVARRALNLEAGKSVVRPPRGHGSGALAGRRNEIPVSRPPPDRVAGPFADGSSRREAAADRYLDRLLSQRTELFTLLLLTVVVAILLLVALAT